jgi:hypothetical protein
MEQENEVAYAFWYSVIQRTLSEKPKEFVFFKFDENKKEVPRPENSKGLVKKHIGELKGQISDWRASFKDSNEGFHAVEFTDRYECHIDKVDPNKDPLGHLQEDSPNTLGVIFIVAALILGGTSLYYFSKKKK